MTKIVAIMGGPNKTKGYSGRLVERVLAGAKSAGADTECLSIYDYNLEPCRACYTCSKKGRCVIDDDYPVIHKALVQSDGFIIATPNYMNNVPSQLKAFFDRSFSFIYHLQALRGKHAVTVISSGGPMIEMTENYLADVLACYGCWKAGDLAVSEGQFTYMGDEEPLRVLDEATDLGKRLVEAIENNETYPEQADQIENYHEAIKALVVLEKELMTYENQYWQDHLGLVEEDYL
jgi:multimeric flavodoxin WrbA